MDNTEKIKVVWICHFSNPKIRELYPRETSRPIYRFARHLLGLNPNTGLNKDFAPWVNIGIEELSKRQEIELHIVAPMVDLKGCRYEFESDGVFYHFFRSDWTQLIRHLIKNPKLWLFLQNNSTIINSYLKKIKPDIINLIGTENAYYSCSALKNKTNAPVFVSLQTVYSNPARLKFMPNVDKSINWYIDKRILSECTYFGVEDKMYNDLIRLNNQNAVSINFYFCSPAYPKFTCAIPKEYDFVNFAMQHSDKKGTTDSVIAMAEVVKQYPNAKLNIVGGCEDNVKIKLEELIKKNHLENNVVFTPYFEKHEDLLYHIQKSKVAVLPVKLDVIPGTIFQSMYYKIPVITYSTSGTPYINKRKERVALCKDNTPDELAKKMILSLQNPDEFSSMALLAKEWVDAFSNNKKRVNNLISAYYAIIQHYHNGVEIPNDLLFDEHRVVCDEDNF